MRVFSIFRLQRAVRTDRHCAEVRQTVRNRSAEVQSHGARTAVVQSAVDEKQRETIPVHSGAQPALHQPHDSGG